MSLEWERILRDVRRTLLCVDAAHAPRAQRLRHLSKLGESMTEGGKEKAWSDTLSRLRHLSVKTFERDGKSPGCRAILGLITNVVRGRRFPLSPLKSCLKLWNRAHCLESSIHIASISQIDETNGQRQLCTT